MGKYESKKEKESRFPKWILIFCIAALVIFLILFVMPILLYDITAEPDPTGTAQTTTSQTQETETKTSTETQMPLETTAPAETTAATQSQQPPAETKAPESNAPETQVPATRVSFPAKLDAGKIAIESLFQFSGVNPDAENQDATDVASIVLTNTSGRYLREATVSVILTTGAELTFVVTDVPSGASVMAFATSNHRMLDTDECVSLSVTTVFEEVSKPSGLDISVDGMTVTVKNTSSKKLSNIDVYYRDVFGERYFGGKAYIYNIENLSAGKSVTFTAEESLLGVIDVIRAAVNDKN